MAASLQKLVLYNSRQPRPGEIDGSDYYFRQRQEIEALRQRSTFTVMEVRGDLQALNLDGLRQQLDSGDVLFEGNPYVGDALLAAKLEDLAKVAVFVAPLSAAEIKWLKSQAETVDLPALVTDIMRRKLLRRTQRQKGILSLPDLENIERRAGSAYFELKLACHFDWVLPNHDGEDSENWEAFYYPLGDARTLLLDFVAILAGEEPQFAEKWGPGLLP
jgi:guanylate kinase